MKRFVIFFFTLCSVCVRAGEPSKQIWKDEPFLQKDVIKFGLTEPVTLLQVRSDRNGQILVCTDKGLLKPLDGKLVPETLYRPLADMKITALQTYRSQFIYLTDQGVLSNAWAGTFQKESCPCMNRLVIGDDFHVIVSSAEKVRDITVNKDFQLPGILSMLHDPFRGRYYLLDKKQLWVYKPGKKPESVFKGEDLTCLALDSKGKELLVGTKNGYWKFDAQSLKGPVLEQKIPWTVITCMASVGEKVWIGTDKGAFFKEDGRFRYLTAERWLPDDNVVDIAEGPEGSVLVLTRTGLSHILFKPMTLADKAEHFDRLIRLRHIRFGLNSSYVMKKPGDFSTGALYDSDNDGLWTAMYLAGELFRWQATKDPRAFENACESFEAMERLYTIHTMKGFPARAFERSGYHSSDVRAWQEAGDGRWAWKATTSSDEIVGHFFALSIFAELIGEPGWKKRAVDLMDQCMDHIVRNNWYLIDHDGKPTYWGKWNPEYINRFPRAVGDRRLNSVEIIGFLETAYHFTGKEVYKERAFGLMKDHGYFDNIMIPITEVGYVEGEDLSSGWNHSDDELAFLSYWNLYHYAFNDTLKNRFRETIRPHWEIEKPEKNPLWTFFAASMDIEPIDLEEAIWTLQNTPLDFLDWTVVNSHRKDLEFLKENFRNQTITDVLPPDERPMSKYNGNAFDLDSRGRGHSEYSGDIYSLPYWLGRYLKRIQ